MVQPPEHRHVAVDLTERDVLILESLAAGARGREIAARLGLSEKYALALCDEMRDKLGARTRAHAVAIYLKGASNGI